MYIRFKTILYTTQLIVKHSTDRTRLTIFAEYIALALFWVIDTLDWRDNSCSTTCTCFFERFEFFFCNRTTFHLQAQILSQLNQALVGDRRKDRSRCRSNVSIVLDTEEVGCTTFVDELLFSRIEIELCRITSIVSFLACAKAGCIVTTYLIDTCTERSCTVVLTSDCIRISRETELKLKQTLQNKYLKLRTTNDIIGIEICGSIKNVIAIASGMLAGMGYPDSTSCMFITESLNDIKNLIKALGGSNKTILSYAGFGDLLLTCTSTKSRNYSFGKIIGEGKSKEEIDNYINTTTIEGLYTLKSIHKLLKKKKVKMPIINLIYDIIFKNTDPQELTKFLIEKE